MNTCYVFNDTPNNLLNFSKNWFMIQIHQSNAYTSYACQMHRRVDLKPLNQLHFAITCIRSWVVFNLLKIKSPKTTRVNVDRQTLMPLNYFVGGIHLRLLFKANPWLNIINISRRKTFSHKVTLFCWCLYACIYIFFFPIRHSDLAVNQLNP